MVSSNITSTTARPIQQTMSRSHEVEPTQVSVERKKVHLVSGDTKCAGWHYPGTNGACVIMAGGFAVTMEPCTDLFAKRFNAAWFTVLSFDYRYLGDSGERRQIVRIREQLADWQAAIAFAPTLRGVDSTRIAIWGFSLAGSGSTNNSKENIMNVLVVGASGSIGTRKDMSC